MKKFLLIRTVVFSASLFSLAPAYSQSTSANRVASLNYTRRSASHQPETSSASADGTALMNIKAQNMKMFNNFSSSFQNATGIKMSAGKNETHISCYVDSVLNKINYSKKGKWLYTIRYFEGSKLPRDIRNIVNDGYPRFSIFGFVSEVNVRGKTAYFVMIENQDSWKRVRVMDEGVDTFEEYKKP
ncbi:MAG: hypothetical protein H0X41_01145 [Chitinophagaceae bacterium]|nr:hypothetical protein [Chitinophagaceae bacterium]